MSKSTATTICEDLLYLIFLHTLPFMVFGDGSSIDISTAEPMNFSMVCRYWRATVLSHPNLWGQIEIVTHNDMPARASLRHFLSKWLQYSQSSPLNIRLFLHHHNDDDDSVIQDVIRTTLAQHFRLAEVNILIYNIQADPPLTLQFSPTLSSLSLCFSIHDFRVPSEFVVSLDFTTCAVSANIRNLCIANGVRWVLPKDPYHVLHFPNLVELTVCSDLTGNVDDFHTVLSACPNIATMTVRACRCILSNHTSTSAQISSIINHIFLSRLTHLTVISQNCSVTQQLLSWLMCPSLIHFLVEVPNLYTDSPDLDDHCMSSALLIAYAEFIARSQPPLLFLSLRYPTWSSPFSYHALGHRALSSLLRPLRALQDLYLRAYSLITNSLKR